MPGEVGPANGAVRPPERLVRDGVPGAVAFDRAFGASGAERGTCSSWGSVDVDSE
jgi:hypothetical protein